LLYTKIPEIGKSGKGWQYWQSAVGIWDHEQSGGGAMVDLGCHYAKIFQNYIGKEIRPVEVMCWVPTQVHPIKAEDSVIGLVKYANGAIGQMRV
jgi:predicted dehydrogenase